MKYADLSHININHLKKQEVYELYKEEHQEVLRLRQEIRDLKAANDDLFDKVATYQKEERQADKIDSLVMRLNAQVEMVNEENERYKKIIDELTSKMDRESALKGEIEALSSKLDEIMNKL